MIWSRTILSSYAAFGSKKPSSKASLCARTERSRPGGLLAVLVVAAGCLATGGCRPETPPQGQRMLQSASNAYRTGEWDRAAEQSTAFLQAFGRSRDAGEAHLIRGMSRRKLGDDAGARSDLREAVARSKHPSVRARASTVLGEMAYERDAMPAAAEHFRRALGDLAVGQAPADVAHYRLGCVLQRQQRWAEADEHFDRVLFTHPDSELADAAKRRVRGRAWTVQAGAYRRRGHAAEAVERLRREGVAARQAAAVDDDSLAWRVLVGRFDRYDRALRTLPTVRRVEPDAFITVTR